MKLNLLLSIQFLFSPLVGVVATNASMDSCDVVPGLNKEIISFVDSKIGKKAGTGQCWDLAAEALNLVQAKWNGKYQYGTRVNPETECIFPGDIIQFEGVKVEYIENSMKWKEEMGHHTAIIYKVIAPGIYELAHQNFGKGRKKVNITKLVLKNIVKGKYMIYRPVV